MYAAETDRPLWCPEPTKSYFLGIETVIWNEMKWDKLTDSVAEFLLYECETPVEWKALWYKIVLPVTNDGILLLFINS